MDCCKPNASPRRRALLAKFQQYLDQVESQRPSYKAREPSRSYETQAPVPGGRSFDMSKLPRYPDYMDPKKRPLITNVQVIEYRPTGLKQLLDLKMPDITGVEYCEIPALKPAKLPSPPPGLIDKILKNKELGYPSPGEKSPYLYRTPRPVPQDPPPNYPPPPPMDHRAGIPCVICEPPVQSGSIQKCPPVARIDTTRDKCTIEDPHSHLPSAKQKARKPQIDSEYAPRTARMRPDPGSARYIEISTDHKCPPGYNEGARTVPHPVAAAALGEPSQACPKSCTDILADQERRSRERRQVEALPGDFKIGEPKICAK